MYLIPSLMAPRLFLCPAPCWPSDTAGCGPLPYPEEAMVPWLVVEPWLVRELVEPEAPSDRSPALRF